MAVDREERERALTAAEQARLERYEQVSARLAAQGYRRSELTIGLVRANVLTMLMGLPLVAVCCTAFFLCNEGREMTAGSFDSFVALLATVLALVVVHELIHGVTWSFFTEHRWGDIEFGFIREYLTPYCTATSPLPRGGYIVGALMPLLTLGLLPTVAGIATGNLFLFVVGLVMTLAAGGDVLIVLELLRHGSPAEETLIFDHPTQAGAVVFER